MPSVPLPPDYIGDNTKMQVDISQLISLSAVRSAAKVIYSPAITTATPIGLRNDPHTATILGRARELEEELEAAVTQMDPFERRDYQQWADSPDGEEYRAWRRRALPLAVALNLVEEAWDQEFEEAQTEAEVDPKLQRLADLSWWFDNHGMWFLGAAFLIAFALFFGIGPSRSALLSVITAVGITVALALVGAYLFGRALPAVVRRYAAKLSSEVPQREASDAAPTHDQLGPWAPGSISGASILNHANWAMLAQPGAATLMGLTAPESRFSLTQLDYEDGWEVGEDAAGESELPGAARTADLSGEPAADLSPRQRDIALTLARTAKRLQRHQD